MRRDVDLGGHAGPGEAEWLGGLGWRTGRPTRRRSTLLPTKLEILAEYDRLTDSGARGALLRREPSRQVSAGSIEFGMSHSAGNIAWSEPTSVGSSPSFGGSSVPHGQLGVGQ
jgi:hypothetical protein